MRHELKSDLYAICYTLNRMSVVRTLSSLFFLLQNRNRRAKNRDYIFISCFLTTHQPYTLYIFVESSSARLTHNANTLKMSYFCQSYVYREKNFIKDEYLLVEHDFKQSYAVGSKNDYIHSSSFSCISSNCRPV